MPYHIKVTFISCCISVPSHWQILISCLKPFSITNLVIWHGYSEGAHYYNRRQLHMWTLLIIICSTEFTIYVHKYEKHIKSCRPFFFRKMSKALFFPPFLIFYNIKKKKCKIGESDKQKISQISLIFVHDIAVILFVYVKKDKEISYADFYKCCHYITAKRNEKEPGTTF